MTTRRAIAFGAAWLVAASSLPAAITVVQWKPGTGNQYLRICWADALVDLPGAPPEGSMCSVEATNSTYVYHDGSWSALGGSGGVSDGDKGDVTVGSGGTSWTVDVDSIALGTDTTGNYAGSSSEGGAATTATALAADPADCLTSQFATSIAASGALTCAALADADIPNTITVDLAATATALAADPTACPGGEYVTDIAAAGTLTCATVSGGSGLTHPQVMTRAAVLGSF